MTAITPSETWVTFTTKEIGSLSRYGSGTPSTTVQSLAVSVTGPLTSAFTWNLNEGLVFPEADTGLLPVPSTFSEYGRAEVSTTSRLSIACGRLFSTVIGTVAVLLPGSASPVGWRMRTEVSRLER